MEAFEIPACWAMLAALELTAGAAAGSLSTGIGRKNKALAELAEDDDVGPVPVPLGNVPELELMEGLEVLSAACAFAAEGKAGVCGDGTACLSEGVDGFCEEALGKAGV